MGNFLEELEGLLNKYSKENTSNTPDFILADYLLAALDAFNNAVNHRSSWYGRFDAPGMMENPPTTVRTPAPARASTNPHLNNETSAKNGVKGESIRP